MKIQSRKRERGQALLMLTVSSFAMFGILGLALDMGWAYFVRTSASAAADAAALSAVQAANAGGGYACGVNGLVCNSNPVDCPASPTTTTNTGNGCLYARANGFSSSGNQNVTMQSGVGSAPPTATGITNVQYWVTARVTQRLPQFFSAVAGNNWASVTARATAAALAGVRGNCIYVLNPTAAGAFTTNGNSSVSAPCGIWVNSSNAGAMAINGVACVSAGAGQIRIVGNYTGNGCVSPAPTTGIAPFADPLGSLVEPTFPTHCDYTNTVLTSAVRTLNPGVYCGGITISSSTVTFNPGTYTMIGGGLVASSAGTTLTGSGVTFYNTACGAGLPNSVCPTGTAAYNGSYHPLALSGNLAGNLAAPTSGIYNNVLYMQDRTLPIQTATESLAGGTTVQFTGAIYAPRSPLLYAGGTVTTSLALISYTMTVTGNAVLTGGLNGTSGGGTGQRLVLVE